MATSEALAWKRWGIAAVLEWQENEALARRALRRRDRLFPLAMGFHFLHGALAGLVFAFGLGWLRPDLPGAVAGGLFGFVLWLITLVIHYPITGSRVTEGSLGAIPVLISLAGHLIYGVALGILAVWP